MQSETPTSSVNCTRCVKRNYWKGSESMMECASQKGSFIRVLTPIVMTVSPMLFSGQNVQYLSSIKRNYSQKQILLEIEKIK